MLEINPHSGKCPPGRLWIYTEDDFTFEDESPDVVAAQVGKYRLEHGKELRDPLQDVLEHIGHQYPHLVRGTIEKGNSDEVTRQKFSEKSCQFLLAQTAPIPSCEIELIAGIRKGICEQCEYCKKVSFDTAEELGRYERILAKYTYGKSFKHVKLGVCSRYMRDCREMIYQSTPNLPVNDYGACWIGKDLSEFID